MRRAALERSRTLRIWRAHRAAHVELLACACEHQPGRFRKGQRIGGCPRPRCWLCHGEKLAGRPSLQQRIGLAAFRDALAEIAVSAQHGEVAAHG